ncbi:hypothetical protein SCALM49S_08513 [Streptomyces californicus]
MIRPVSAATVSSSVARRRFSSAASASAAPSTPAHRSPRSFGASGEYGRNTVAISSA